MTIIDTTLYADGALRLSDHGPRGGGLVLKHEGGKQVDITYHNHDTGAIITPMLSREITAMVRCNYEPEVILEQIAQVFNTSPH